MSNINIPEIVRNGVTPTFTLGTFGKKSEFAGLQFPYIEVDEASLPTFTTYLGMDTVCDILTRWSRTEHAALFGDHYNKETGETNWALFWLDAQEISAGIAKKSELQARIDALIDEQSGLMDTLLRDDATPEDFVRVKGQLATIAEKIVPIRKKVVDIEAKYAARLAAREAKKAAAEANSPTKVQ